MMSFQNVKLLHVLIFLLRFQYYLIIKALIVKIFDNSIWFIKSNTHNYVYVIIHNENIFY